MSTYTNRGDVTDTQWVRLEPLLPPEKPWTGHPNLPHRSIINGILWIKRTGAPWRDIPERYGNWNTIASRYYRWCKAGVWQRIWETLQAQADAAGRLDWETHFVEMAALSVPISTLPAPITPPLRQRPWVARKAA